MRFVVPVFVEARRQSDQRGDMFLLRPLFFPLPLAHDRDLRKATGKMAQSLQEQIKDLCRLGEHREAVRLSYDPAAELRQLEIQLDLGDQMFRGHFPMVFFRKFQRRLGFCPLIPGLWFDMSRGDSDESRAEEALRAYFRGRKRSGDFQPEDLAPFQRKTRRWLTRIEIDVATRQRIEQPADNLFSLLGGQTSFDGEHELRHVGRCQDFLFPTGLRRAAEREELVEQLTDSLESRDKRAVLLVGPRLVGKTSLVHEYVYRRVAKRSSPYVGKRNTWLLSPQRLISGMSFVGGWEERLLSILKVSGKKRHILYFDDLIGLFYAGISANSSLCAADVLKPYIERRDVQVLAEMTPEAHRVFQERDRGFSDLFEVIRVDEPNETTNYRILLARMRELELEHGCQFDAEVIPTVIDITRRYQRDAAMPGKAAVLLEQLAISNARDRVNRGSTLYQFRRSSGLDFRIMNTRVRLDRQQIVDELVTQIVGQRPALEALTDVISIAKARLNDPQRPLGALLFVGPTGVGKTETAKALTRYMFSDDSRLLRFDMNEYVAPDAAARLVGTFSQPEGVLTSSVRRQPFSVILLDEIEKAHPDVFDLLLQVLGEGRLTDGLGRTTDFGNSIIIMTSNLGTAEAQGQLGFQDRDRSSTFLQAVEAFFRPEFFNRLDRIVPFAALGRQELAVIADRLLGDVLSREGLVRRKCSIQIEPSAIEWVIDRGYHPDLGARAMKRAIQQELVEPVSDRLAGIAPNVPTLLRVGQTAGNLEVDVAELHEAAAIPPDHRPDRTSSLDDWLRQCGRFLERSRQTCATHKPAHDLAAGESNADYYDYLATMELIGSCRSLLDRLGEKPDAYDVEALPAITTRRSCAKSRRGRIRGFSEMPLMQALVGAEDINQFWNDLAARREDNRRSDRQRWLADLMDRLAILQVTLPRDDGWHHDRVLLMSRTLGTVRSNATAAILQFCRMAVSVSASLDEDTLASESMDLVSCQENAEQRMRWFDVSLPKTLRNEFMEFCLEGPAAYELARRFQGTHLVTTHDHQLVPVQTIAWTMHEGEGFDAAVNRCLAAHEAGVKACRRGEPATVEDPLKLQPVIWLLSEPNKLLVDVRTGISCATDDWSLVTGLVTSLFPLPAELQD